MKFICLPNNRWCIEHNNIRGLPRDYAQIAYWPNEESPEIFGMTAYFGKERAFVIKNEIKYKDISFSDESVS